MLRKRNIHVVFEHFEAFFNAVFASAVVFRDALQVKKQTTSDTLTYTGGSKTVSTTCWWDKNKKIPAGTYYNCSATTMATKTNSSGKPREAIYIPNITGYSQIFIHMGTGPSWSDGCIVIPESDILSIWQDITQKNGHNITVTISNA